MKGWVLNRAYGMRQRGLTKGRLLGRTRLLEQGQTQAGHQVGAQETTVELHFRKNIDFGLGHEPGATAERNDEDANT